MLSRIIRSVKFPFQSSSKITSNLINQPILSRPLNTQSHLKPAIIQPKAVSYLRAFYTPKKMVVAEPIPNKKSRKPHSHFRPLHIFAGTGVALGATEIFMLTNPTKKNDESSVPPFR